MRSTFHLETSNYKSIKHFKNKKYIQNIRTHSPYFKIFEKLKVYLFQIWKYVILFGLFEKLTFQNSIGTFSQKLQCVSYMFPIRNIKHFNC